MTTGIFGGSFNPVHRGHTELAQALLDKGVVDEVWLTLSPLNPLKAHPEELVDDRMRLEMLRMACKDRPGLHVCDIELRLPRPSYTINTLRELSRLWPERRFRLIIGSDNMMIFDRWKEHEEIAREYTPIVYPRPGYPWDGALELPVHDVSSTEIRERIKLGADISGLVDPDVENHIKQNGLYRQSPDEGARV